MPNYAAPRGRDRLYRTLRFGRNVDLFVLDQRQYRDDQPCDDAVAPGLRRARQPRTSSAQRPDGLLQDARSSSSKATWKVIGNEVMIMPIKAGRHVLHLRLLAGLPGEREELLSTSRTRASRTSSSSPATSTRSSPATSAPPRAASRWRSSSSAARSPRGARRGQPRGGNVMIPGNDANPKTAPVLIERCAASTRGSTTPTSTTTATASRGARSSFKATLPHRRQEASRTVPAAPHARLVEDLKVKRGHADEPPPAPGAARLERLPRGGGRRDRRDRAVPARHRAAAGPAEVPENPWLRAAPREAVQREPWSQRLVNPQPPSRGLTPAGL